MKKVFLTLAILLVAATASAELCEQRFTPHFTAKQSGLMCTSAGLANDTFLTVPNAAGTGFINAFKVDSSDDTVVNADSGDNVDIDIADTTIWTFTSAGDLAQQTAGESIKMSNDETTIILPAANGISAAGSAIGDATDLTKVINNVTTVAASTGVQLWDPNQSGGMQVVRNGGANALSVYPPNGTATINGGSAGAAVAVAAGETGIFWEVGTDVWIMTIGVAP